LSMEQLLDAVGSKLLQDDQQSATSADSYPALNQVYWQYMVGRAESGNAGRREGI